MCSNYKITYDAIQIGRKEFVVKVIQHETQISSSIVGELKTNTKFEYCKLITEEDLPKINIDAFCKIFSLDSTEERLEELKKITKSIFIFFDIPREEWDQRIEQSMNFLDMWTEQFRKNGTIKVPDTIKSHLRNNFQDILLNSEFKLK
ncbi:hypothetical protein KO317_01295 [Candidatus Micrarchaeota archaeon]|nr:hypothetical protein [Candidatus Micrarchaeota archaeon]